jgi:hypothetical protein
MFDSDDEDMVRLLALNGHSFSQLKIANDYRFASIAVSGGASLPIIGALLGHANSSTTQRYAHLSDDPLRAASEAVGSQISAALSSNPQGDVIKLARTRSKIHLHNVRSIQHLRLRKLPDVKGLHSSLVYRKEHINCNFLFV